MNVGAVLAAAVLVVSSGCRPQPSKQELVDAGNRHFWRAEYVEAIGPYTRAAERDPSDADVLYLIGRCHFSLGNYREAIKWYRQAIKSYPGHAGAGVGLAEAQRRLPNWTPPPSTPETGPDSGAATSPRVVAEGYISVAKTWEVQNDLVRALESFKKAVEAADDLAVTHAELGRFYMRTGRNAEAIEQLKQAQKLNPNEPGVADDLARLQAR